MLDPTKVGFEKVGFEKRLNPKSRMREKFGRVFRKGAFERLHAKKIEFEQSWIREKVGFEHVGSRIRKSWIPKVGFDKS